MRTGVQPPELVSISGRKAGTHTQQGQLHAQGERSLKRQVPSRPTYKQCTKKGMFTAQPQHRLTDPTAAALASRVLQSAQLGRAANKLYK